MELKDKIKLTEDTLAKSFQKNLGLYKQTYITVFGKPFHASCSCQIGKIRTQLQEWLNKNKPLLNS